MRKSNQTAMPFETVKLRINGIDWQGWLSCQITRSVDALAGGFALGLTDRWEPGQKAMPLAAGMSCEVLCSAAGVGDTPLIRGFIDKVDFALSATTHSVNVQGRDASGDLVDCAAVHRPGQWLRLDAAQIAAVLAQPFGVPVSVAEGVNLGGIFPTFKIEPGETAFDALSRALKQRELLCLPDGRGGLVLSRIGQVRATTAVVQGVNVLSAKAGFDLSDRYSVYIAQGQRQGSDAAWGAACSVRGEVRDDAVPRYRPHVLRAAQQGDAAWMRKRAVWERTLRAAKSTIVSVTVQGWRQDDGSLWPLGGLVDCDLPWLGIDQSLCLARIVFTKSASAGTTAQLELKDPDAFQPEPEKPSGKGGTGGGSDLALLVRKAEQAKQAQEKLSHV